MEYGAGIPENARILVVRPDRIGDVTLSTPVFSSIRAARPEWRIAALVRPAVAPLLGGHPALDEVLSLATDDKPTFDNTRGLARRLAQYKFDVALHLFSDFWISLAVWRAGVRVRIGPASKLARIFYNVAVVQRRSKGTRHEADHNLDLLAPLGIPPLRAPHLPASPENLGESANLLRTGKKNIGVFPGMGGSARNWRAAQYAELIALLQAGGWHVILMGGAADRALVDEVENACPASPARYTGDTLPRLAAFISQLDCFVAPSTGPLHIASAVGTPAVGIYCPIRVCLPQRWGPIGARDTALTPPDVPACERCIGPQCAWWDCMDRLTPASVADAVKERI